MEIMQRIIRLVERKLSIAKLNTSLILANRDFPLISYAHPGFPDTVQGHPVTGHGGSVKYRYLDRIFPHSNLKCNVLYVVSSGRYDGLTGLLKQARKKGIAIVWNQNGAFFPSAYGRVAAQRGNTEFKKQLTYADYVLYQSRFARQGSEYFMGAVNCPAEILHNAVDTALFTPGKIKKRDKLTLLLCGSHNDSYRLPLAIEVFRQVLDSGQDAELLVAGRIPEEINGPVRQTIAASADLAAGVTFLGPYSQAMAPEIYRSADILLHTQYNDVCPTVVLEAMSCGLPIAYSKSGGTPELVGEEAGVGVESVLDWDTARPPSAGQLAQAVLKLTKSFPEMSMAARKRVVENFDLSVWLARHQQVIRQVLENKNK